MFAFTAGILFQLDANTFKTVVAPSKRDGKALIKTLRSIELLQALTVGQLEQLAQIMRPVGTMFLPLSTVHPAFMLERSLAGYQAELCMLPILAVLASLLHSCCGLLNAVNFVPVLLQESVEDGAYIVQQGDHGDCMFVVQSGEVIASHRATGDVGSGTEVTFVFVIQSTMPGMSICGQTQC